jgi:hypothetical protein
LAQDLVEQKTIISEGLRLFKALHVYKARFFVAPNGPINNQLEKVAADRGIQNISSPKIQNEVLVKGKQKDISDTLEKRTTTDRLTLNEMRFLSHQALQEMKWINV